MPPDSREPLIPLSELAPMVITFVLIAFVVAIVWGAFA
jgi:hypothetical protein